MNRARIPNAATSTKDVRSNEPKNTNAEVMAMLRRRHRTDTPRADLKRLSDLYSATCLSISTGSVCHHSTQDKECFLGFSPSDMSPPFIPDSLDHVSPSWRATTAL